METKYTFDENIVSDLYKDAYGSRPGEFFWADWAACNDAGKQRLWDQLMTALEVALENEREHQQEAIADFEDRIRHIMTYMVAGCTREDAIRYMHDAYKTDGDVEYLEFLCSVPYGYISGRKAGWLV